MNNTAVIVAEPEEGFRASCRAAGKEGWRLARDATFLGIVGIVVTVWLPELFAKLSWRGQVDGVAASIDGRLAAVALTNCFAILATLVVVPKPVRRQQYTSIYAILLLVTILAVGATGAHLVSLHTHESADDRWICWISWGCTVVTLVVGLVATAVRFGEEKILASIQPMAISQNQAEDFEKRVSSAV